MHNETISHKRLWAWLAVAMSAPLAHFSGGSWLALLSLGIVCWGVTGLVPEDWSGVKNNRFICLLELVWIIVLLSQLVPLSAQYWPGRKSEIVTPWVLLALGAYSCRKRPSRVSGVLFWVIIIMYIPVVAAGVKDVQVSWLAPQSMDISLWMVPVLLLPCAGKLLTAEEKGTDWYPGIVLFGLGLWILAAGMLSPSVAANVSTPFRELSRSLTIGAASRFESVISVLVTLGWFGLCSLLIRCGSVFIETLGVKGKYPPWIVGIAAGALQLSGIQITEITAVIATIFLWIVVPILLRKNVAKGKNKA